MFRIQESLIFLIVFLHMHGKVGMPVFLLQHQPERAPQHHYLRLELGHIFLRYREHQSFHFITIWLAQHLEIDFLETVGDFHFFLFRSHRSLPANNFRKTSGDVDTYLGDFEHIALCDRFQLLLRCLYLFDYLVYHNGLFSPMDEHEGVWFQQSQTEQELIFVDVSNHINLLPLLPLSGLKAWHFNITEVHYFPRNAEKRILQLYFLVNDAIENGMTVRNGIDFGQRVLLPILCLYLILNHTNGFRLYPCPEIDTLIYIFITAWVRIEGRNSFPGGTSIFRQIDFKPSFLSESRPCKCQTWQPYTILSSSLEETVSWLHRLSIQQLCRDYSK